MRGPRSLDAHWLARPRHTRPEGRRARSASATNSPSDG
jgi:hypothetical protein